MKSLSLVMGLNYVLCVILLVANFLIWRTNRIQGETARIQVEMHARLEALTRALDERQGAVEKAYAALPMLCYDGLELKQGESCMFVISPGGDVPNDKEPRGAPL